MKMDEISREKRIDAYLAMSPKIVIIALNHHHESGDILDTYQKFDFKCLIEALERSNIDCSEVFIKEDNLFELNGPFRLDNHPDHRFGIHISWELKLGISKFQAGNHWKIIERNSKQ